MNIYRDWTSVCSDLSAMPLLWYKSIYKTSPWIYIILLRRFLWTGITILDHCNFRSMKWNPVNGEAVFTPSVLDNCRSHHGPVYLPFCPHLHSTSFVSIGILHWVRHKTGTLPPGDLTPFIQYGKPFAETISSPRFNPVRYWLSLFWRACCHRRCYWQPAGIIRTWLSNHTQSGTTYK